MEITAKSIVEKLKKKGHQAYFAGGSVRDILLGIKPKDIDIATSALPHEIETIFDKTVPIGKKFGVILVIENDHQYEIATFRSDSGYSDGRRPDAIKFSYAHMDAMRRDFTINGLFYDPVKDQVIDFVRGERDLKAKLVRFIGNPEDRILEDHLRLIRAVRFRNQFDFQYHPDTYQAIKKHTKLIKEKVSMERIRDELNKMILDQTNPSMSFEDMSHLGLLELIIPELEKMRGCPQPYQYHQEGDVWEHTMRALDALPPNSSLTSRWATLFHDIGKPETFQLKERIRFDSHAQLSARLAKRILKRLSFSKKFIDNVCWCVEHHMMMVPLVEMNKGRQLHWFLNPEFPNLLQLMEADAKGTVPSDLSLYQKIKRLYLNAVRKNKSIPDPLLDGHEIMKILNIEPSQKITEIKAKLVELQIERKIKTKKQAIIWLKSNF
ncbi:HD domain-containing protein [Candidatus Peregrinibacteria bacterium]|nr:HD domain-containing protein [Candidatus Peregrinibacteria bacterium]